MKIFFLDHNGVMKNVAKNFETTTDISKADVFVLWNDVNPVERGIVQFARNRNKPSIVIQHGRRGTSRYYPPFSEKIQADKLLVWGENDRNSLTEAGQDPKRIKIVGSPAFRYLKPRLKHDGINIVFSPEHWDRPIEENKKVRKELQKIGGATVITKIIDSPSHIGLEWQNPVYSNREEEGHLEKCVEVLETADIVVGISESTFELLAQAMDIPVVIVDEWTPKAFGGDERYVTYRRVVSEGAKKTTVKNLRETILDQLKNPNELWRERRYAVIEDGGAIMGEKLEFLDTEKLIIDEIRHARK